MQDAALAGMRASLPARASKLRHSTHQRSWQNAPRRIAASRWQFGGLMKCQKLPPTTASGAARASCTSRAMISPIN